jgi:hypothetical protein
MGRAMLVAAALSACGGSSAAPAAPAGPSCPQGNAGVEIDEDARAMAGCRVVPGDLAIGPSLLLDSLAPLGELERVEGSLEVSGNVALGGLFLPELRRVGGAVSLDSNGAAMTISLHRLEEIGGDLRVTDHRSLERLDLGSLRRIGGRLEVSGNRSLDTVVLDRLSAAGELALEDNPAWPDEEVVALRRRLGR